MQTYYHTQETVCSNARSLLLSQSFRCYRYLQQEKSMPTHQKGQKRDKELTKSASVIDPAALLTPTSHHHPISTVRGTASTRTPYYSSCCHRWEMSRRRETGDAIVYVITEHARMWYAHCAVRTQPSLQQQYFARPLMHESAGAKVVKREGKKEEPDCRCRVRQCLAFSLFSLIFAVLIHVCAASVFFRN